ncbi:tyrosine-type recombinase/integrase [Cryobacterium sp. Y82]|uniref:tyrosine-type recombinase/integrase n=1 Tax=Cryobacterium sp. Y82 TaxID=2045017 RepID=UPI0018EC866D|nr:tyrosine-type recombinase/integrase [Cryobacterium sp. Y82]
MNLLARLSLWMQTEGAGTDQIGQALLDRFVIWERSRTVVAAAVTTCMGTMRRFLIAAGYFAASENEVVTEAQAAVTEWRAWMRDDRGLLEKTIDARCYYGAGLVDVVTTPEGTVEWFRLGAPVVNAYVAERGRPCGAVTRAHIVDAVRCLLRWALSTGRISRDPTAGVLKPPGTRRTLPRGVGADQVAALLSVCDPATAIGARDRAVVTILVRLGLRAGEAARLTLDDIDWTAGQLKVSGKGREHTLPIPVDVGEALEAWLRARPPALDRGVFVRMKAPRRMMTPSGISGSIARLSDLASVDRIYAHRLRHTAAMDVLASGGTLTEAKELLGHVYTVTTMAYAKVDLISLRVLAVPFGQVPR